MKWIIHTKSEMLKTGHNHMKGDDIRPHMNLQIICLLILVLLFFLNSCSHNNAVITDPDAIWYQVSVKELPKSIMVHTDTTRNGQPKYWVEYHGETIYLSETNKLLHEKQIEPLYVVKNRHVTKKNITKYWIVPSSKLKRSE